ncbi:MAG: GIY-YIG nuclease family protein [Thermoplasmata archaeon]|nr:GIY-YIG nuclease family protein [Thermoplasmata archaeon]
MKGSYVIISSMKRRKAIIGKLGEIEFRDGYYAYVGSAMNSIEARIERHLRKNKKMRWHIDYFLEHAKIEKIFYKEAIEKEECWVAKNFASIFESIPKFGASDCKCKSHLFYSKNIEALKEMAKMLGMKEWNKN